MAPCCDVPQLGIGEAHKVGFLVVPILSVHSFFPPPNIIAICILSCVNRIDVDVNELLDPELPSGAMSSGVAAGVPM